MLSTLYGNAQVAAGLQKALSLGSLPHAVLLCAPGGCGRNYAARCLAADYLFPDLPQTAPPVRAVMQNESPEVLLCEGEGKSGQIKVDRIRQVRADIFRSALSAAGRVVLVRDAHNMAAPAANALLKVLEEPPSDTLFILTSRSPTALPATILSRCAQYTLAPAGVALCREVLTKKLAGQPPAAGPAADPDLLAVLFDGRLGLCLSALEDEGRLVLIQDALAAARAAGARDTYALLRLFSGYEGRAEDDRERRDTLLSVMADALSCCLRGQAAPGLPQLPAAVAAMLLPPITKARAALRGNTAPKITFAALAIELAQAGQLSA